MLLTTGYKSEVANTSSLVLLICYSSSQNLGNQSTHYITSLLQRILKDTNPQPDVEIRRVRSMSAKHRSSSPWSWDAPSSQHRRILIQ